MKLFSIDYIPGADIEAIGLVKGAVVMSKNIGKDIGAGFKTIIGRQLKGHTEMLDDAGQIATRRMTDEAEALGADAVVNVRYGSASILQGAAEILAYGTAARIIEKQQ